MIAFNTTVNHNYHDSHPTPSPKKKDKNEKDKNPLKPHARQLKQHFFLFSKLSTKIFDDNVKHNSQFEFRTSEFACHWEVQ